MPSKALKNLCKKTRFCRFFYTEGCSRGGSCTFAHGIQDLRPEPDLKSTRLCPRLSMGASCFDQTCTYAHNTTELRSIQREEVQNGHTWPPGADQLIGLPAGIAGSPALGTDLWQLPAWSQSRRQQQGDDGSNCGSSNSSFDESGNGHCGDEALGRRALRHSSMAGMQDADPSRTSHRSTHTSACGLEKFGPPPLNSATRRPKAPSVNNDNSGCKDPGHAAKDCGADSLDSLYHLSTTLIHTGTWEARHEALSACGGAEPRLAKGPVVRALQPDGTKCGGRSSGLSGPNRASRYALASGDRCHGDGLAAPRPLKAFSLSDLTQGSALEDRRTSEGPTTGSANVLKVKNTFFHVEERDLAGVAKRSHSEPSLALGHRVQPST